MQLYDLTYNAPSSRYSLPLFVFFLAVKPRLISFFLASTPRFACLATLGIIPFLILFNPYFLSISSQGFLKLLEKIAKGTERPKRSI